MSKYLNPISVPDPQLLSEVQRLCDIANPYAAGTDVDELFLSAMEQANTWHAKRSPFFRSLWDAKGASPASIDGLGELPMVHANLFKTHEILSLDPAAVSLHLTSSGTSGQKSQMFFDEWTIRAAQRMVAFIFDHYGWITPDQPVNYLLSSYQPTPGFKLGTSFTDNYLCDFAPANSVEYVLRHTGQGHEFDMFGTIQAMVRFAEEGMPVRILGFPAFLYFTLERMRDLGVPPLRLHPDSLVFFGGGWKGHADKQIAKTELYDLVEHHLGIPNERLRDGFGSVEHCVPYVECRNHNFHVPVWSRVLIRSVSDRRALPFGERGFLQLVSPYVTSVPAQSVVMADLASLYPAAECGCGLSTPWFVVHGRAGISRNRSCAVAAAELLKGK
ncbi:long-chain-fatty-acid--CoA ligase [Longimycelium tulufanense]|uniref:Long-chain-fatty-acid--CoA ligase n=1 Tax=Longimycelium tulufanense TaxID=907463 RepID=A0A8J3CA88_9PSEU|nr:acyl-protein synthase [Longimycelium tulufanense]GGM49439.1 long-chain-fatty-acid--CoA ligase [Longimycelium tulufanense]